MPISVMQTDHLSGRLHGGRGHQWSLWWFPIQVQPECHRLPQLGNKKVFLLTLMPKCRCSKSPVVLWQEVQYVGELLFPYIPETLLGSPVWAQGALALFFVPTIQVQAQEHPWGITSRTPFYYQCFVTATYIITRVKPKVSDRNAAWFCHHWEKWNLIWSLLQSKKGNVHSTRIIQRLVL